jgi:hypothetical protein
MRIFTGLAGALSLAATLAFSTAPAGAVDWCGFQQKAHARVHCGYSSLETCKQALADKKTGDKTVTCMPDPTRG